jgi:hypothetical protein
VLLGGPLAVFYRFCKGAVHKLVLHRLRKHCVAEGKDFYFLAEKLLTAAHKNHKHRQVTHA